MTKKNYTNRELLKRFLPYMAKYKYWIFLDLFAAAMTTVNELVLPIVIRNITNMGIDNISNLTRGFLFKSTLLIIILKAIDVLAFAFMQNTGHVIGAMIETDMRMDIFSHLQEMSANFYSETKIGKLMTRITNDLFEVTEFAHHTPEEYFIGAIKLTVSFVVLYTINSQLTLALFAVVPVMFFAVSKINQHVRRSMYNQRSYIGELNAGIEDTLQGISEVRAFTNEDYEVEKFGRNNQVFLDIKKDMYFNLSILQATARIFDGIMYVVVIAFGGSLIMKGKLLPGDLVIYMLYVNMLAATVRRLVDFTESFHKGMTGIEKFAEVMDSKIDIFDEENAIELKDIIGEIKFNNVWFRYDLEEDYVLKDINLKAKAGEDLALVGPSGGGKTTIINLIPRFYDIDRGSITIDGIDIRDVKLESLRKNIGIVQQDVYLFNDSILENIRYGKPDASIEEVKEAARLAGAEEFILNLPEGYDTSVGERGLRLSGGQKQRISIARVFLKNPKILILDEATSALDNESEEIIQKSLQKLSAGRTTVTIAHRLSTIYDADNIIVITKDGIAEEGSHEELLEYKGLYFELHNKGSQSFDDSI